MFLIFLMNAKKCNICVSSLINISIEFIHFTKYQSIFFVTILVVCYSINIKSYLIPIL